MGGDMRYSDEKLAEMDNYLRTHVARSEERAKMEDERYLAVLRMQEKTAEAVKDLARETKDIVQLHRDIQGAVRIGSTVQKLLLWLVKWGAIGTLLAGCVTWGGQVLEKLAHVLGLTGR